MPTIPTNPIVSRALNEHTSNTVIASVLGSVAILLIFGLAVVWLLRYREQMKLDKQLGIDRKVNTLVGYNHRYEFDRKEISSLYSLQRPKTAVVASFRTSFVPPNSPSRRGLPHGRQLGAGQPPERGTISPPLRSSVWRGKQWVTISRPKTSTTPAKGTPWQPSTARPRGPMDLEKGRTLGTEQEKKSGVQRLSQLISKMKSEWHDVDL
jgi:hypothetical protein